MSTLIALIQLFSVVLLTCFSFALKPVHAGNVSSEKPTLMIQFYYDNPCSSCPTVSDFKGLIWQSASQWSEKITIQVLTYPTFTTDGSNKLQELLDEYKIPQNERLCSEVALIGNQLLLGDFTAELPSVLAEEADRLMKNTLDPTLPVKTTQSMEPTSLNQFSNDMIFISSESCENCKKMKVLLTEIEEKTNLTIIHYDVNRNAEQFRMLMDQYQVAVPAVPVLIYQDRIWVGYNPIIVQEIRSATGLENRPDDRRFFLWNIDEIPLVFSTVIIGLTDGFNPCSLWALLFLISMIIRFQSRKTLLTVGLTFILVVSIVYGLFVLGLFGIVGSMIKVVWLRATLFALTFIFGVVNVYSFFSKNDPLVSISNENKKRFIQQIRSRIFAQKKLPGLILATVLIAILASLIELPCTAGFPVIWNAILTEQGIGPAAYFPLLGLYLSMYILDELMVVLLMTYTMKKLFISQTIGRALKLISGLLMVYLALVLLLGTSYFSSTGWVIVGSAGVLIIAAAISFILLQVTKGRGNQ